MPTDWIAPSQPFPDEAYHLPQRGYTGHVEGWRVWRVDDRLLLMSVVRTTFWTPGVAMVGWCMHIPILRELHQVGVFDPTQCCLCGCYAFKSLRRLDNITIPSYAGHVALGKVALWGTVTEHRLGYRAAFAYPTLIASDNPYIDMIANRYEVKTCKLENLYEQSKYIQDERRAHLRMSQVHGPTNWNPNGLRLLPGGKK